MAAFIAWISYVAGSMIDDIGKQNEAYTTDWLLILSGIGIIILVFIWGYVSNRNEEND